MLGFLGSLFYRSVVATLEAIRFYDARNERYAGIVRERLRSVPPDGIVADLGCGIGAITRQLDHVGLLVGVDRDREALSHFRDPLSPRLQARAERLPFKDGRLDAIVAISLVEHVADQAGLFREFARVLRPGGQAVLQMPELRFPFEPHTKWPFLLEWHPSLRTRILQSVGYEELNLGTSRECLAGFAKSAGFRVGEWLPQRHFGVARILRTPMGYFVVLTKR